jgi:hypothetical protein
MSGLARAADKDTAGLQIAEKCDFEAHCKVVCHSIAHGYQEYGFGFGFDFCRF